MTEPFTDFQVTHVTPLSLTRIYSSADASLYGGPHGVFGRGWRHDWEGALSCEDGICTVMRGMETPLRFASRQSVLSPDGTETWDLYRPFADVGRAPEHHHLLVRHADGTWVAHLADGRELHFRTVCDACGVEEQAGPLCRDPAEGGRARLTKVVESTGVATVVGYDRPSGVLLSLRDDLGHELQLRGEQACATELAEEVWYEGAVMARYTYDGVDLTVARDADGQVLRSYEYIPESGGRLWAVKGESGAVVAEFSFDTQWRAIGVVDSRSSVAVQYAADGSATVTEYFRGPEGDTSATSVRAMDEDRRVVSISDDCACGPAAQFTYADQGMTCSIDAEGRTQHWQYDALGRIVRSVRYPGAACPAAGQPPPSPLPVDSTDETYAYSTLARRLVAQGVWLDLDRVQTVTRPGAVRAGTFVVETADSSQARAAIDPADYTCAPTPLPAGSVVCRSIVSGRYKTLNAERQERHATFNSYDARGRLVRTYGPVNLDYPSPADVVPIEERTYWPDDEASARRGRLRERRRYPSPAAAPLVTSLDYDAFGPFQITEPSGGVTTILKDARGRPRFVVRSGSGTRETRYADGLDPRLHVLPSGAAIRTTYDGRGRVAVTERFESDPEVPGATPRLGWSVHFAYDAAGNRIHSERRDATGHVTWQEDLAYDVHHGVVREPNPESPSTARTRSYGPSGFLVGSADEEGRATAFTLDALGRVKKVRRSGTDPQGLPVGLDVAVYGYAQNVSAPVSVTDGKGQRTDYLLDDFGRLNRLTTSTLLWASHDVWLTPDARGNVVKRADSSGVEESFTYDGLDRIVSMAVRPNSWSPPTISYTYRHDEPGGLGRLTSVVEADRTVRFGYDAAGRLSSETIQEAGVNAPLVTSYTYDADGQVETLTIPRGSWSATSAIARRAR